MVDKKISELDPAGPLTGVEELAIVQGVGPDTVKTTVQKVIEAGLAFKGALVEKSTAQSIPTAVSTAVSWDAETLDIGGFWTAGQPTRLTIPSGISKVRLSSNVEWANNSTGRRDIVITKNGTTMYPGVGHRTKNAVNESWDTVNTGVISVITGDYFEVIVYQNSGSSLDVGGDVFSSSWFQIEVVEEVNSSLLTGTASLGNLSDVDLVPAPTDGQTLSYNSSTSKWEPYTKTASRNFLINGSMAVAQRGTSFTSTTTSPNNDDAYTLDRWYILSDGNDIVDVTQETTTIPTNGKFAMALDVETLNKKFGIAQIIEGKNCVGLIGNTVTLSFKAKVSSTTNLDNVKAAIVSWSGTEDTVTSDIVSAWGVEGTNPTLIANATYENTPVNLNLTTSYATYSVTAAIDTASTKNVIVFIWSDVTTTSLGEFLYITDVQLEPGSSASDFVNEPFGESLAQCQRYYEISNGESSIWSGNTTNGSIYYHNFWFFVQKRRVPDYSGAHVAASGFSTTAATLNTATTKAFRVQRTANDTVAGGFYIDSWTANAEL